ncbi:hypothetical protein PGT21_019497 [Puccinia graminis f. sp. tritici]|uniref:Uncharacterized protein n=1 Tax=Puccinia graminis f. sp. tritici TaxID=56615 RepID=A0A5B0QTR9_PUCGR|nr:hypothetical protein PGT21_019497 [Puccinia graminis f. sp. tritici]
MLFNKGMLILAGAPCLVLASTSPAWSYRPNMVAEQANCEHPSWKLAPDLMLCRDKYVCNHCGDEHSCGYQRQAWVEKCTKCGYLQNPTYNGDCPLGKPIPKNMPCCDRCRIVHPIH